MLSWENSLGHLIGMHSESEKKMKTDLKLGYEFELAWNESLQSSHFHTLRSLGFMFFLLCEDSSFHWTELMSGFSLEEVLLPLRLLLGSHLLKSFSLLLV